MKGATARKDYEAEFCLTFVTSRFINHVLKLLHKTFVLEIVFKELLTVSHDATIVERSIDSITGLFPLHVGLVARILRDDGPVARVNAKLKIDESKRYADQVR